MRVFRSALAGGLAVVVTGGLTVVMVAGIAVAARSAPPSGSLAHPPYQRMSVRFLTRARTALVRYLGDDHPQADLVGTGPAGTGATPSGQGRPGKGHSGHPVVTAQAYNWSGYADVASSRGTFTEVGGAWTTPALTCGAEDTITSEWAGIDGLKSTTVEQAGTLDWCFQGKPTYFTWYEMYPQATVDVGTSLQPGDRVSATITRRGTSYTMSVTDSTHPANSFTRTTSCAAATCPDLSAEWVAERPTFGIGVAPMADYGTWAMSNATETAGGRLGTTASFPSVDQLMMVDATDTYQLAATSGLGPGGNSFTTTWRNSY